MPSIPLLKPPIKLLLRQLSSLCKNAGNDRIDSRNLTRVNCIAIGRVEDSIRISLRPHLPGKDPLPPNDKTASGMLSNPGGAHGPAILIG